MTRTKNHLRRFADESGQTIVFAALIMVVLMGLTGLAIDVGHMRHVKRQLQRDADAAALAAAREIRLCGVTNGSSQVVASCPYMTTAATSALAENESSYSSTSTIGSGCAQATSTSITLSLNVPPACVGGPTPSGNTAYVEAVVTKQEPTYFARVLGIPPISLGAHAVASRNSNPPCIYALDPDGPDAIDVTIGLGLQANCAIIDESSNADALTCTLGIGISAPQISITGGAGDGLLNGLLCGSNAPTRTGVLPPTPADPLAYLPAPPGSGPNPQCGTGAATISGKEVFSGSSTPVNIGLLSGGLFGNIEFKPGVYCGGINITPIISLAMRITFDPGVYILTPQGNSFGLTINAAQVASYISGDGVMFYSEGPAPSAGAQGFNINLPAVLGTFNLSAPTSGEYAGVLFFQPADNTAQDSFLISIQLLSLGSMDGAIYAPGARVFYGVSIIAGNNNILVAKDISLLGGILTTFGNPNTNSPIGSPLVGDDAVLVQ